MTVNPISNLLALWPTVPEIDDPTFPITIDILIKTQESGIRPKKKNSSIYLFSGQASSTIKVDP